MLEDDHLVMTLVARHIHEHRDLYTTNVAPYSQIRYNARLNVLAVCHIGGHRRYLVNTPRVRDVVRVCKYVEP